MIKKVAALLCGLMGMGLVENRVDAATAVGAGAGHPWTSNGSIPWSVANAGNARLFDNYVCYQFGGGSQTPQSWVIPLAIPVTAGTQGYSINQTRSAVSSSLARSQAFSFFPDGSVFHGINEINASTIGSLFVPAGGTAFTKHFLSFDVDGGTGCIYTVTY
jgi:hypothetical protein